MQNCFGLLDTDVMPIFMIIVLDIIITLRFSINCSAVICSPTVIISILREASSETYGPRVYFPSYKFPIYNFRFLFLLLCNLYFPFHKPKIPKILLYHLSSLSDLTLQITVKGLTTPLPHWVQGWCLFVQVFGDLSVVSYWIDTLVLKSQGKYLLYFAASPFPLQGKNQRKLKK